jgi:superfamily II RNA helicase
MKHILFFAALLFAVSCSNSPLVKHLEDSDSVVIQFNQRGADSTLKKVTTTEAHAIQTIIQYIDGEQTDQYKCVSDGNILFYKKDVLTDVISFNFSVDGCHHFLQQVNGKPLVTKMSNEAVDFLIALTKESK